MEQKPKTIDAEQIYAEGKNDHKIINAALYLKENEPKKSVTLVTKDINLRIKAKALGVIAEDYETGKVTIQNEEKSNTIEGVDSERIREIFTKGRIDENGICIVSRTFPKFKVIQKDNSFTMNSSYQCCITMVISSGYFSFNDEEISTPSADMSNVI